MNRKTLSATLIAGVFALSLIAPAEAARPQCNGNNGVGLGWGQNSSAPPGLLRRAQSLIYTGNYNGNYNGNFANQGRWGYSAPRWNPAGGSSLPWGSWNTQGGIDTLQSNLATRIQNGVASGRLTQAEADRLLKQSAKIDQLEARYRQSGNGLSSGESNRLFGRLNDLRASLSRDLSNRQFR